MSLKKKIIAMSVIAGLLSSVSCGEETKESSAAETPATTIATEAEPETTAEPEEITEEETTAEPEETTEEETEAEEISAEPDISAEVTGEVMKNSELLSLINNVFGMTSDGTFEGDLDVAKAWDVVDSDAEIDPDAEITAEFLVSASMRATGIVTGADSMDDIIACAVEKGVIESENLSEIDVSKAADIVESARYAWTHQEFDNEMSVELAEGVIDFTGRMNAADVEIDGSTIKLPAEFAAEISDGSVILIPVNPDDADDAKAYVADSVIDNGDGTITINSSPADFTQVYGSIN